MSKSIFRLGVLFTFSLSIFSCRNSVPAGKYILWRNDFRGQQHVVVEELEEIIPFSQKENSKPLELPITPRVWWYNFGLKQFDSLKQVQKLNRFQVKIEDIRNSEGYSIRKIQKIEKKAGRIEDNLKENNGWFWRNIGEKQVYAYESQIAETSTKIRKFLFDIGYRDAEVFYKLDTIGNSKKIKVMYHVSEKTGYVIDTVKYYCSDSALNILLKENLGKAFIKKGNLFDLRLVQAEKLRLEQLFKNNGYYNFNNKFLLHGASNPEQDENVFKQQKHGELYFEVLNPGSQGHEKFNIEEVVFKAFDPSVTSIHLKPDTVVFNGVKFIRLDQNIPLNVLSDRIITRQGNLYRQIDVQETQRQVAFFNQFSFASSQVKPLAPGQLSVEYFAPLLQKYSFGISPGINNIYNDGSTFFGFGVPVSLTSRNRFRKLETIEAAIRASYEGQPSPIISNEKSIRGSLELGLNLNVTLPNLWLFPRQSNRYNLKNPRTILGLGYNYSEPFWGKRLNFKVNTNYSIQLNKNAILYFSLLDASLINTIYFNNEAGQSFYNSLISLQQEQGNNLKVTFDPQFVSSINSNLVFNKQDPSKPLSDSRFFRLFLESGGTVLNFLNNKDQISLVEKLFPLKQSANSIDSVRQYFRFVKINADFRRNININKNSSYAFRLNLGVINPYGNNRSLPYDKNFFVGGSNSVRAWAPRTLGVGSAGADTTTAGNTIPQPGDILFESSIEYRLKVLHFAGDIQIATFLDAGNVWKWHNINSPSKVNKSNFDLNRFYKEIGVGTGFGIRWDLSYFLFRFDWGIKVFDPARTTGQRFVLDEFSLKRNQPYGLNWNFGIGYPF
ncbi:MAG: outer membrane protein assembly factor [Bacteroidetes bacterium]|nr:outer membrane protein assembly factor [Bacteroidota bacterium]